MGAVYATAQDVANRWRTLTEDEQTRAVTLAADASLLIRARFPGIDAQVEAGALEAGTLTIVVAGMVKRAMLSGPDGVTQQSETVGPFSQSQTFANPMGNVFLTAADLVLILGQPRSGGTVAYANDTTQGAWPPMVFDGGLTIAGGTPP